MKLLEIKSYKISRNYIVEKKLHRNYKWPAVKHCETGEFYSYLCGREINDNSNMGYNMEYHSRYKSYWKRKKIRIKKLLLFH